MGTVINLRIFRGGKGKCMAREDMPRLWACSECGSHAWEVSTSTEIRCAECGTRAGNLAVVETTAAAASSH